MVWDKEALYAVATNLIEEIHPTLPAGLRLTIMLAAEDDDNGFNVVLASSLELHVLFDSLVECADEVAAFMKAGLAESPDQRIVKDKEPT